MYLGIRSVIYPSSNLEADTSFWTKILGKQPYFAQPYYVGFDVDGYEVGLDPNAAKEGITVPVTYLSVDDVASCVKDLLAKGVKQQSEIQDVGEGILMCRFVSDSGHLFGLIEDPHVKGKK